MENDNTKLESSVPFTTEEIKAKIISVLCEISKEDYDIFMKDVRDKACTEYMFLFDMHTSTVSMILDGLSLVAGNKPIPPLTNEQVSNFLFLRALMHQVYDELKAEKAN